MATNGSAFAPYRLTKPCATCPFRTDIRPYLRPERVDEMEADLERGEFYCHKTVNYDSMRDDDEGEPIFETRDRAGEAHCAGALILLEKLERPSQMMRIAERLRLYDARKIDMHAPVFDTFDEMREAMERGRPPRRHRLKKSAKKPAVERAASTRGQRK
jgi:hypothetical protein